jgi:hypothetical protein
VDNVVDKSGDCAFKTAIHKGFTYTACFLLF